MQIFNEALIGNYQYIKDNINDKLLSKTIYYKHDNITIWHSLAYSGNYEGIKQAIADFGNDIKNVKSINGTSIWHFLALSGNYNGLKEAIEDNGDCIVYMKSNNGDTVWHYLALSGNYKGLKQAIEDFGIKDITNNNNNTIWHNLASSGNYESLRQAINDFGIKDIKNGNCSFDFEGADTIWHNLASSVLTGSGNYDDLQKAVYEYNIEKVVVDFLNKRFKLKLTLTKSPFTFIKELRKKYPNIKIPLIYLDPILFELMTDPVVTSFGNTYDRKSIETWLKDHDIDPVSLIKLENKNLVPNLLIRQQIINLFPSI